MGSNLVDQKHKGRGAFVRHIGDFAGNPACGADGRVEPPSLKKPSFPDANIEIPYLHVNPVQSVRDCRLLIKVPRTRENGKRSAGTYCLLNCEAPGVAMQEGWARWDRCFG